MEKERPPRLSAVEARKKYGIRAAVLLALILWFGYDGWFNKDPKMLEHTAFNRTGTVLLTLGFLFCAVMAGSAALTVRRQQQNQQPTQPPPDSSPPA